MLKMNKEIVKADVHAHNYDDPKNMPGDQEKTQQTRTSTGTRSKGAHNIKPSRRWLMSEVQRLVKRNSDLTIQLDSKFEVERSLVEAKTKLERELALLKSRRALGSHEIDAVRERNRQLTQDIFLMKNILVKLNVELEHYQTKLRKYERETGSESNTRGSGGRRRKEINWMDEELTIFAPLVKAYEGSIEEKEELIHDMRKAVEDISGKLKDVITENTQLRDKFKNSEKQGEVTYTDWVEVQREMALINEQNMLFKRQSLLSQSKLTELKTAFQAKISSLSQERDDLSQKLTVLREEHLLLRGKFTTLEQEHQRHKEETSDRIPKSVHLAYLSECKRLLDELKARHEEENSSLQRKISELESSATQAPSVNKVRELEAKVCELEDSNARSERRRIQLKNKVDGLVAFSKELIAEHESLLAGISGELNYNMGLASRVEQIKQHIKDVELETLEQIKVLDENIGAQVDRVNKQCCQQKREIERLRQELLAKEALIQRLTSNQNAKKDEDMNGTLSMASSEDLNY